MWGGRSGRQDVCILTETGDIDDVRLEADVNYATRPDEIQAFVLDYNQQAKDEKTGRYVQTVSELSKRPLKVFRNVPVLPDQDTDTIADQKWDEAQAFRDHYHQKNSLLMWFAILAIMFALVISIMVLVRL